MMALRVGLGRIAAEVGVVGQVVAAQVDRVTLDADELVVDPGLVLPQRGRDRREPGGQPRVATCAASSCAQ